MTRVVSGIQPTNNLHIGNYLGAIRNWVKLQDQHHSLLFIADLHSITVAHDPARLLSATRELAAAYIASGIDAAKCLIFAQSAVHAHAELGWILGCHTPLGWLNRMTQFKEKAGKQKDAASLGLYGYPVLMAADVLLYKATHVPVGEDQKQHLELARDIAGAVNRYYGVDIFPLPEPLILGEATRVMSLRDGSAKMSKSAESEYSRINLTDDSDAISQKIKKAKTDAEPLPETAEGLSERPEARNLVTIYAALADMSVAQVLAQYAGQGFGAFKPALADLTVEKMAPIAARMRELLADQAELDRLLAAGAATAAELAAPTLAEVKKAVGFWHG